MDRLAAVHDVAAPAATVWRLLTDVDCWPLWGPTVHSANTMDGGPLALGTRGSVETVAGVTLSFEITEFTEGSSWSWKVVGIPATDHSVTPTPGGCRVRIAVPLLATPYLAVCQVAVGRIARLAVAAGDIDDIDG
jgi:uncharacterized protein YndB with AHSA1/START domain